MAADLEARSCFKDRFNLMLYDLVSRKDSNSCCMNSAQYSEFLDSVKIARKAKSKSALQYRRLKRFDVCVIGGIERLISPVADGEANIRYFVKNEEIFDILHEIHLAIGHGGKHRMLKEVNKKYKNITQEVIMVYLKLCVACQTKQKSAKKGMVVKPMVFSEMNRRGQVDVIDMQSNPDGVYKFIMVYQDHSTKFVQIRPLQSKRAEEVAKHLLDIFCIFGAPSILQSDNGREFANRIIEELCLMWSELKIVHGKLRHSQSQGSVERANQDIQNMLMTWMTDEKGRKWSAGLPFVQLMKNRAYHDGIKLSPYKAMFGSDVKVGLRSSSLPKEIIEGIHTEEELENIINEEAAYNEEGIENLIKEEAAHNQEGLENIIKEEAAHNEEGIEYIIKEEATHIEEGLDNIIIEEVAHNTQEDIPSSSTKNDERKNESRNLCSYCNMKSSLIDEACKICSRKKEIIKNRRETKSNLENQAKKMKEMSIVKFPPCNVGDTVRVKIPDVERGRGDSTNVLMSVLEVGAEGLYRLGNENGTVEEMFSGSQFMVCESKLIDINDVSSEKISLRQIANCQSISGGQGYKRCQCKAKCSTLKCRCKFSGVLCNPKCHSSLSCANK